MIHATYLRYEVVRNFRNWRFLILTLAFPLVLYFTVAGSQRSGTFEGTSFPLYYMSAMATLGSMAAVISSGAVIAAERSSGWTRQMRTTPLSPSTYFTAKVLTSYIRVLLTIVLLSLAGLSFGVRLPASEWLTVVGLLLVGLIPFAVLGIMLGHVMSPDASTPAVGGIVTLFALVSGVYGFQLVKSGPLFDVIKGLPSFWLAQAGRTVLHGGTWPTEGWIVIACWTVVLVPLAVFVYQHDTNRI